MRVFAVVLVAALAFPAAASATFATRFNLGVDQAFKDRVSSAILDFAVVVALETNPGVGTDARRKLARTVLEDFENLQTLTTIMAHLVARNAAVETAAGDPPTQANVSDAQITTALTQVWNAYAEVFIR